MGMKKRGRPAIGGLLMRFENGEELNLTELRRVIAYYGHSRGDLKRQGKQAEHEQAVELHDKAVWEQNRLRNIRDKQRKQKVVTGR